MAFSSENLPTDDAAFEAQLTQLIRELPPLLLRNLHILLTGCTQGALALWREPGVDPSAVDELEILTGLSEERVRELSLLREPEDVGRVLLTTPVRLHALTALGLALLDTPLLDRFTRFMERPATDHSAETWTRIREAARDIGPKLMTQFEERTPGPLYDVEDILAERNGDLPEAPRMTGDDLRLKRLQIEGLVLRTFGDYVAPDSAANLSRASEDVSYPPEPDPDPTDDDPDFQDPYLMMSFLEPQLAMLQLAVRLPLALRMLTEHRFGEAARTLRWLRQTESMQGLLTRLEALRPEQEIELSLADLLRLYQGTQFMALALVGDVMRDLDEFLSHPAPGSSAPAQALHLSEFFDAPPDADGDSPRRAIFQMVEGFLEMIRAALDTDLLDEDPSAPERLAVREAQAEIDDLSNLV
jgi:hypothetical protein